MDVQRSFLFWSCVLLLVIPSLGKELWQHLNGDEQNDNSTEQYESRVYNMGNQSDETMQYEILSWYNQRENNNLVQYKLNSHFMNSYQKDNNILMKPDNTCIQLCCCFRNNCTFEGNNFSLQNVSESRWLNKVFQEIINESCKEYFLFDNYTNNQSTMFLHDDYQSHQNNIAWLMSKCLDVTCQDDEKNIGNIKMLTKMPYKIFIRTALIISWMFLLITFVVYSVCPELRNMHGYALRSYVGSLFLAYTGIYFSYYSFHPMMNEAEYFACVTLTFIYNIFMFASFLWQNVICFDLLWTFSFRKYQLTQGGIRRRRRKMLVICSIYAWGTTSIYAIMLFIVSYVPNLPKNIIQTNMCVKQLGIEEEARFPYFYIPVGIIIICNICFFIVTTIKIAYAKKETDRYLKDSESKCQQDNRKRRFIMYLKLFILMDIIGIKWTLETVARNFVDQLPLFIWFTVVVVCGLQGFIVFMIFVCRQKVKQLLLKHFACLNTLLQKFKK